MIFSSDFFKNINPAKHIYLAYSGGLDSHVLLHLCANNQAINYKLTAVYVHHGLQKIADDWAIHCQQQADLLGINFKLLTVNALASSRKSPEEEARNARYHALKKLLNKEDILLVAQHREDQLETVLLQLFRGAGVQGLSAMAEISVFGQGKLLRPLLDCSQQSIKDYALTHSLNWVEDPTNQCDDFERNFLRNQIVPRLKTHWQSLDKTVARSAKHCAKAQSLLTDLATDLLAKSINLDNSLAIDILLSFNANQQTLIIRQWFAYLNLRMPSANFIEQLFNQVIFAKKNANPLLKYNNYCIRRYQNTLYCLLPSKALIQSPHWLAINEKLPLSPTSYLHRINANSGFSQKKWASSTIIIKYRTGGEKIALPNRKGHHCLKKLFQEAKIPPWERERIPLIYLDNKLAAIADLWISSDFFVATNEACYQLKWVR